MSERSLLTRLASPKLAAWLIGILILMTVLSVVVPQQSYMPEDLRTEFAERAPAFASVTTALRLDRLWSSWPVMVVTALLLLNVISCTLLRIGRHRKAPAPSAPASAPNASLSAWPGVSEYLEDAASRAVAAGWLPWASADTSFLMRRGASGFWGSVLLHASIIVIVIGGVATAATGFRGEILLTDGQTLADERAAYIAVSQEPRIGSAFSGTELTQDRTEVLYDRGVLVSADVLMRATEPSGRLLERHVRVNHPLDAGGKSYLLLNTGYAVELVLTDPGGAPVSFVVNLAEETPFGWRDEVTLSTADVTGLTFDATATPVSLRPGERLPREKLRLVDPRLRIASSTPGTSGPGAELARGDSVALSDGSTLTFGGLRFWNRYTVRGEPARWIVYLGFWLAVVGAAWRFLMPERRLAVVVRETDQGQRAFVAHRSRPWPGFAESADRALVEELLVLAENGPAHDSPGKGDDS